MPQVGSFKSFELDNFESRWTSHPNGNIDLCVMPIAPLLIEAEQKNETFFFATLDKSLIPAQADVDDMVGLESVTMVGYWNVLIISFIQTIKKTSPCSNTSIYQFALDSYSAVRQLFSWTQAHY